MGKGEVGCVFWRLEKEKLPLLRIPISFCLKGQREEKDSELLREGLSTKHFLMLV